MLNNLTFKKNIRTFSISPENPTGKKGEGGKATLDEGSAAMAARELMAAMTPVEEEAEE